MSYLRDEYTGWTAQQGAAEPVRADERPTQDYFAEVPISSNGDVGDGVTAQQAMIVPEAPTEDVLGEPDLPVADATD